MPENSDSSCFSPSLWKKDGNAIISLMFLYVLQGIPLGLISAMPLILTNKGITYEQQALFSLAFWPFSLKLLWAPFVDSLYVKSFGRRKTWLIPIQYLIGLFMLYISANVDKFLDFGTVESTSSSTADDTNIQNPPEPVSQPQGSIELLTFVFFMLNFFAATQDIAVDGWCLTMLSKENVGWASTCNTVGQTAGWFIGNVGFLALESVDFSNNYFRKFFNFPEQEYAIVNLAGFLKFWGVFFIMSTTLVGIFKHEKKEISASSKKIDSQTAMLLPENTEEEFTLKQTYKMLWHILQKRLVILYIIYAMTSRIGFTVVDSISGLKMVENGMPKENLAMMAVPMIPIQIILPLVISKYTAGPRPLKIWYKAVIPRIFFGLIATWICYQTKIIGIKNPDREEGLDYPISWYIFIIVIYAFHQMASSCHFVSIMAFHAKVSDPEIGGTSMTLMNTVSNLGGSWMSTVSLYFVDKLSQFSCDFENLAPEEVESAENLEKISEFFSQKTRTQPVENFSDLLSDADHRNTFFNDKSTKKLCQDLGGKFITVKDGFYLEVLISTILVFIWLLFFKRIMEYMDSSDVKLWHYDSHQVAHANGKKLNWRQKFWNIFEVDQNDNQTKYIKLENYDD